MRWLALLIGLSGCILPAYEDSTWEPGYGTLVCDVPPQQATGSYSLWDSWRVVGEERIEIYPDRADCDGACPERLLVIATGDGFATSGGVTNVYCSDGDNECESVVFGDDSFGVSGATTIWIGADYSSCVDDERVDYELHVRERLSGSPLDTYRMLSVDRESDDRSLPAELEEFRP